MAVKGKGSGILDPVEDFEKSTTRPGSQAETDLKGEEVVESETQVEAPAPEQKELALGEAAKPKPIRNNRMLAQLVKPFFEKDAKDERYVGFDISLVLTKEHDNDEKGYLPKEILTGWKTLREGNIHRLEIEKVAPQTVTIGLDPADDDKTDITLVAADVRHPVLAFVETSGAGKTEKIVRFSFRAVIQLEGMKIATFAIQHFGKSVWFSLKKTQRSLLDDK